MTIRPATIAAGWVSRVALIGDDGAVLAPGRSRLLAPIPRPARNVFCVGRNCREHVAEGDRAAGRETEVPKHPHLFSKPPTAVIGPDETVPACAAITRVLAPGDVIAAAIEGTGTLRTTIVP